MCGKALGEGCILQDFFLFHRIVMDTCYFKYTLCQGTGLVKYDIFRLCQSLQIVGSFDQNTGIAGSADSGKEAQWNTDHKCARAADYEECQRTVDPLSPLRRSMKNSHAHKRRQDCQGKCSIADCRSIITGKF